LRAARTADDGRNLAVRAPVDVLDVLVAVLNQLSKFIVGIVVVGIDEITSG